MKYQKAPSAGNAEGLPISTFNSEIGETAVENYPEARTALSQGGAFIRRHARRGDATTNVIAELAGIGGGAW